MSTLWVGAYGLGTFLLGLLGLVVANTDVITSVGVGAAGLGLLVVAAIRLLSDHRLVEQAAANQQAVVKQLEGRCEQLQSDLDYWRDQYKRLLLEPKEDI